MAGMYSAKVMEHFANPHNVGEIPDANGVGEVGNPKCGDIMRMYLIDHKCQDSRMLFRQIMLEFRPYIMLG